MADIGVVYTLTATPSITFNQGVVPFDGTDKYYITEIRGLESADIRTPMDSVPLGDGALIHDFWFGARHIGIEGVILVNSVSIENDVVEVRNSMTQDLDDALESLVRTDGTLAFTPQGESARSIIGLRYEVGLQTTHGDNYHSLQFSFGLVTGDPST